MGPFFIIFSPKLLEDHGPFIFNGLVENSQKANGVLGPFEMIYASGVRTLLSLDTSAVVRWKFLMESVPNVHLLMFLF